MTSKRAKEAKRILDRDAILALKPNLCEFELPEWEGVVYLRQFTLAEQYELSKTLKLGKKDEPEDSLERLVLISLCDDTGARLLKDEDLEAVRALPFATLSRLGAAIFAHNGMGPETKEAATKN